MLSSRLKQFLYLVITKKVEDYEEAVPGSLDTRWRGAGAHLHGEDATVGSGALEATRLHFSAQAGAPQGAHFEGGGGG